MRSCASRHSACPSASAQPKLKLVPPRTYGDVVKQARAAFRNFRELKSSGAATKQSAEDPYRLALKVPLPVTSSDVPLLESPFTLFDESEYPGGYAQKFRALRPLVESILEGYDAEFLGMLESPADGTGCWSLSDTTVVTLVGNATFSSLAKLCEGGFGSKPLNPSFSIIAVNPEWTRSKDIGQPWDWELKRKARALIDDAEWDSLYGVDMVRTSRGKACGMMVNSYQEGWWFFSAASEMSSTVAEEPLLWSATPISTAKAIEALNSRP